MRRAPALTLICLVALMHAAFYIAYQRPDWNVAWTDQGGYRQLGAVLAETGMFTRYPDYPVFVPEVIRTPGYPALVAVVYALFGVGNHMAVAIAQAALFALIAVMTFAIARRVTTDRVAFGAGLATALFSPIPYFGALMLTEVPATFVLTAAMFATIVAARTGRLRQFVVAGVLLSLSTLVRPVFVLLPFFLAIGVPLFVRAQRSKPYLIGWASLVVAASVTLLPWFTYNYVHLDRFTLSPAGGIGRGLWEGSWQGRWPGKVHAQLTALADTDATPAALDARVEALARENDLPPGPMLTYVHEWRDIRKIWVEPEDPLERARARVTADQEYLRAGLLHIREDPMGFVRRRLTRGLFVLWAAEVPIRHSDINDTWPIVIRAIWLAQVGLLVFAASGLLALARSGRWLEAVLLALPIVYVTGVHLPLLCEARQSLPVKPIVIVSAAIGVAHLVRLFALKPQVHERQHV